jgi:hypothetical protein
VVSSAAVQNEVEENVEKLLAEAIQKLEINVPVLRYEIRSADGKLSAKGSTVTLWLYGHTEPVTWTKRTRKRATKATS